MLNVLRGLTRDADLWRRAPRNPLVVDGIEVVDDLLTTEACDRIVSRFDQLRVEGSPPGDAYWVRRLEGPTGRDQHVTQLMNAQDADPDLRELHGSGRIEGMFAERLGEDVVLESTTVQLDDPDTETKRGFHVDRVTPPTFKLFTYLTDVPDLGFGPYTVVPGSHRHLVRKLANVAMNRVQGRQATDMSLGYSLRRARAVTGAKGKTILSAQTVVHRGWPGHDADRRVVLICYVALARHWSGRPFDLGRHQPAPVER